MIEPEHSALRTRACADLPLKQNGTFRMAKNLMKRCELLLSLTLLAGCVTGPELNTRFVHQPSRYVNVEWLHAYPHKQGLMIVGHLRASRSSSMLINGHLHITGNFVDHGRPVVIDTGWGSFPMRGNRMARFSALLPTLHPELITNVEVEYRLQPDVND
jgi:hypothetical protein